MLIVQNSDMILNNRGVAPYPSGLHGKLQDRPSPEYLQRPILQDGERFIYVSDDSHCKICKHYRPSYEYKTNGCVFKF